MWLEEAGGWMFMNVVESGWKCPRCYIHPSQGPQPTPTGDGRPMSLKAGNFSLQARTAQNWLRMGKYGTYLEWSWSQEAPEHCQTFDSLTQCYAGAHFRLPPICLPLHSITDFFPAMKPYFWVLFQWWNILSLWVLVCPKCSQYIIHIDCIRVFLYTQNWIWAYAS